MGCFRDGEFKRVSERVKDKWAENEVLKRYNISGDSKLFSDLFETATGKLFEAGTEITAMDMRKTEIEMDWMIKDLIKPGLFSNKMLKYFYVGRALARHNPVVKKYYERSQAANNFRSKNTQLMTANYTNMIGSLKEAILAYDGISLEKFTPGDLKQYRAGDLVRPAVALSKKKANEVFNKLSDLEKEVHQKMKDGKNVNSTDSINNLFKFLKKEGAVFEDFIMRVTHDSDAGLKKVLEERSVKGNSEIYVNRLNKAAASWKQIQDYSRKELIQSLNNLTEIVEMKYGRSTKTSDRMIEEYKGIISQLESFEGGYIPHYLLNLLGHSLEIRDKMTEIEGPNQSTKMDGILKEYVSDISNINLKLIDRLKSKSTNKLPEPFSRNPLLYADKYIKDVVRFNYNTYNDLHFTKGLRELTSVIAKNPGDSASKAANFYKKLLVDLHGKATGRGVQDSPTANNIFRTLTAWQYVAKLGWSIKAPLKNLSQRLWEGVKWSRAMRKEARAAFKTEKDWDLALNQQFDEYGLKFTDISKLTRGAVDFSMLESAGIMVDGRVTYRDKKELTKFIADKIGAVAEHSAKKSLILGEKWSMQTIENGNRRSSFELAFYERLKQLQNITEFSGVSEKSDPKKWEQMTKKAGAYAAKWTSLLHFDYNPVGKSELLGTKVGGTVFQFQHFLASVTDLHSRFVKDYVRAFKAGDYASQEASRLFRMTMLATLPQLLTLITNVNFSQYVGSEVLNLAVDLATWLNGDEEVKKDVFYGGGLVSAIGAVAPSDIIALHNAGVAANYWNHALDPDSKFGQALGFQDLEPIDNAEFMMGAFGRWGNVEMSKFVQRTIPATTKSDAVSGLRAEFGLYGTNKELFGTGGTSAKELRRKFFQDTSIGKGIDFAWEEKFGVGLSKKKKKKPLTQGTYTTEERDQILAALAKV